MRRYENRENVMGIVGNAAAVLALKASAIYVALIVLMGIALTFLVIYQRRSKKIGMGDGGDKMAARLIRVHGNFAENAPPAMALLILLPLAGAETWAIHGVGLLFLAGRAAHAFGLSQTGGSSVGRVFGMLATLTALIFGALMLIMTVLTR
jgi:uncharacterized protein